MAWMMAAMAVMQVVGGAMSAKGTIAAGEASKAYGEYQANQLRVNAGQAQASAQREAIDKGRQTQLVESRQLALAAASGGGASDPTVSDLIAKTAGEGEYQAAMSLFNGEETARGLMNQANAKEFEGDEALKAAKTKAQSTMISSFGSAAGTMAGGGKSLGASYR